MRTTALHLTLCLIAACAAAYGGEDGDRWPAWRGPAHNGVSADGNPPVAWAEGKNIKWKVSLTGDESSSSPIIWGDKLFFQTAVETDRKAPAGAAPPPDRGGFMGRMSKAPEHVFRLNLVCMDRSTGKVLWEKTAREAAPHQGHHRDHGFASFSPVTDGRHVWASFGSNGMFCFDLEGNKVWEKELVKMTTMWGEGSSPALAGDAVIAVCDHRGTSYIFAFDKKTGNLLWKRERDEPDGWATPHPVEVDGKLQVVVSGANRVRGYDARTGAEVWQCGGQTRNVIPMPVSGHGMVYCTSGFRGSNLQAIKLGLTGDLTGTEAVVWQVKQATPYVPSPLLYQGRIYVCAVNAGVISCYDAKTGKAFYTRRKLDAAREVYSSPVGAAGRVYFVGRRGTTYVLDASDDFKVLAVNRLNDRFDCSPAIIGKEMYLKGKKHIYCIAGE